MKQRLTNSNNYNLNCKSYAGVCHGKPTIRGMRYPVDSILEYLASGDSIEDILAEFSDLEREDILACFAYASASMKLKDIQVPAA